MKNNKLIFLLVLVIAVAFYLLGKKNAGSNMQTSIVQNVDLIKEIAELAALKVSGTTNLKMTNREEDEGYWKKFKNYFMENTLQMSIPYEANYGVDMANQQLRIDTKKKSVIIYLPECKLLSFQLKLDSLQSMTQTGILYSTTIDDFTKAQKKLYSEAYRSLQNDQRHVKLAEDHIRFILEKYYRPLGYEVVCVFAGKADQLLN